MPEGHTIHRLARDHGGWLCGEKLEVTSPQLRFADGASKVSGADCFGLTHGESTWCMFLKAKSMCMCT